MSKGSNGKQRRMRGTARKQDTTEPITKGKGEQEANKNGKAKSDEESG